MSDTRMVEPNHPEAVLLDAAGTLIKPIDPVGETYATVARRFGAEIQAERLMQAFAENFGEMPEMAFEWTSRDELWRLERDWWRTLVSKVLAWTGSSVGDFDGFFDALYAHYANGRAWECFPEVPGVLGALRARGCRLAVVSNFDSRLPGILRALGLHARVDAVFYSTEAGSAKPDPAIFREALNALGVAPDRAIHVGDNVKADVEGAAAAGVAGLLIKRGSPTSSGSVHVIESLDELLDVRL